jgi:YD repeat-containing protein
MKQWLIILITLFLLSGCASSGSILTPTPAPTAVPTTIPTPAPTLVPTPEPSPTPTILETINQYVSAILRERQGTDDSLLDTALPLARFLWGTDGEQYNSLRRRHLVQPEDTRLVILPAHDLYPERTLAVQVTDEALPNTAYPPGTLVVWTGGRSKLAPIDANTPELDRLGVMILGPSQPGNRIMLERLTINGRTFNTFIEYNTNDELVAFFNPDSYRWAVPLALGSETNQLGFYIEASVIGEGELSGDQLYWISGDGESVLLDAGPYGGLLQAELEVRRLHIKQEVDPATGILGLLLVDEAGRTLYEYDLESKNWISTLSESQMLFIPAQSFVDQYGIELDPELTEVDLATGHITWFSRDANGNPVETVRTARDVEGNVATDGFNEPILVFAAEAYAMSLTTPLTGGDLGRIQFRYHMALDPYLSGASLRIIDAARVNEWIADITQVPARTPVQNVLSQDQIARNELLTADEAAAIATIVVHVGFTNSAFPGFRPTFYTVTPKGPGSSWYNYRGYLWNPERPEELHAIILSEKAYLIQAQHRPSGYYDYQLLASMMSGATMLWTRFWPLANVPQHFVAADYRRDTEELFGIAFMGGAKNYVPALRIDGLVTRP